MQGLSKAMNEIDELTEKISDKMLDQNFFFAEIYDEKTLFVAGYDDEDDDDDDESGEDGEDLFDEEELDDEGYEEDFNFDDDLDEEEDDDDEDFGKYN